VDDFLGGEASSIVETLQKSGDRLVGLRDQTIRRKLGDVGTTRQELELRSTRALTHSNGTGELNEVTSGDVVVGQDGEQEVDRIDDTDVSEEEGLDGREKERRTISTTATEFAFPGQRGRECNGIVESETECFVNLFTALVVENVVQQVISDGEEGAACLVCRGVDTIGTGDTLVVGSRDRNREGDESKERRDHVEEVENPR